MDTDIYYTALLIELDALGSAEACISLDNNVIYNDKINSTLQIYQECNLTSGNHVLVIEHKNKQPHDSTTELIVTSITFNGITSPKFVWEGIYIPNYPEPWATEQRNSGGCTLEPKLTATNHLGWNGKWVLTFTAPIFTWIHQVEDLGWIHQ